MSAVEFFAHECPLGNAKTLTYMLFGVAQAFDEAGEGMWLQAEDTLAKVLVAGEQAAIDNSSWQTAWLLSHLPEPPWNHVQQNRPRNDAMRPFAKLSDPTWTAAAIAYSKDVAAMNEMRSKNPSAPKGKFGKDKEKNQEE